MNAWIVIFLGGDVGDDLLIPKSFPNEDSANTWIISTGAPWNYQTCHVYGPAIPPPMGTLGSVNVRASDWIAVASGITSSGGVKPIGYGNLWTSKPAARSWASTQGNPSGYSFGQCLAAS